MFCSWGSSTKTQPLGQVDEYCPHCARNTYFSCYEIKEQSNVCYIPCWSSSKGKFARCNVCGIQLRIEDSPKAQINNPTQPKKFDSQSRLQSPEEEASVWYDNAKRLYQSQRYEEALTNINRSIDIKPSNGDFWNTRGIILACLELHEEALLSFEKSLELDKTNMNAIKNRNLCLAQLRKRNGTS
jgi:tetratricopeptide (TPR) repeat protein